MNINLIGGISFGLLGIGYSAYLLYKYFWINEQKSHTDYGFMFKGITGAGILMICYIYCFYKFFMK